MGLAGTLVYAFVTLQVAQTTALDLGPSINPFSDNKQFIVRVVDQLPSLEHGGNQRLTTYRDAGGQDFSCVLPGASGEEEVQVDQQALFTAENAQDLLQTITGDCVRQKEGWWIFEVCVGVHVRQYHTTNGVVDEEYMLGQFNETEQDYTLQGQQGSPLHASQVYSRGQVCDLTGMERHVDVRFLCSYDPTHIRAIEEIVSCQYVIVVGTPAICSEALGTLPGGREKVRLKEVFCKAHESSRDTRTVVQQAIAASVEKAQNRGATNLPEPSYDINTQEKDSDDTAVDGLQAQGTEESPESADEQQEVRQEL